MARVLVLYAHPGQRHSQVGTRLVAAARTVPRVSVVDLYALYPRFKIDVDAEQARLLDHDVLVLQFPVLWYSTPALLKEWQDLVLEYRFAYGPGGDRLAGKVLLPAVTAGGRADAYCAGGSNRYPLRALFAPLEQTARLCRMVYLPPFALFDAHAAREDGRGETHARHYSALLEALRDDRLDVAALRDRPLLDAGPLPLRAEA